MCFEMYNQEKLKIMARLNVIAINPLKFTSALFTDILRNAGVEPVLEQEVKYKEYAEILLRFKVSEKALADLALREHAKNTHSTLVLW